MPTVASSTFQEVRGSLPQLATEGKVHLQAAKESNSEPERAAQFIKTLYGWSMLPTEPIAGFDTNLSALLLGPFDDEGIEVSCGVPRNEHPGSAILEKCRKAAQAIVDNLACSDVAAIALPTSDVPEGDLLIQVFPKPTLEDTMRRVKTEKERVKRDGIWCIPNSPKPGAR